MREWFSARSTRADLMRRGAVGGSAVLAGGVLLALPATAGAKPSRELDEKVFQFALQLEYLQAAFYKAGVDGGALDGEVLEFAKVVSGHEQEHVDFLRKALGSAAGAEPPFDFGGRTTNERSFLYAATLLENAGVAAYNGQAANLTRKSLGLAAQIVSVEGRHAAWVNALGGRRPAPRAADPGAQPDAISKSLKQLGFVQ
jgi:hypothetical protein